MKTITCARCNHSLERLDMSRGALVFGGTLPALYGGVVCNQCGKVECTNCKGAPMDGPCSWCRGSVSPAYENLLMGR